MRNPILTPFRNVMNIKNPRKGDYVVVKAGRLKVNDYYATSTRVFIWDGSTWNLFEFNEDGSKWHMSAIQYNPYTRHSFQKPDLFVRQMIKEIRWVENLIFYKLEVLPA